MNRKVTALLMLMMMCSTVFAAELPDVVGEWHCVSEYVQPLTTEYNGETQGRTLYRTYSRENPVGTFDVILTEGTGTGSLYVPENVNTAEGLMPSNEGFELLTVSGHRAIMEAPSYMPLALAVNAGDNIILTIESISLGKNDLVRVAEEILSSWRVTE